MAGARIVAVSWAANVLFVVTAVPAALGVSAFADASAIVAILLFLAGLIVFAWGFAGGLARSARGENVAVANLFFLQGSAPRSVRMQLLGSLLVSIVIAGATAAGAPFGVLVPMLPLALVGLWGARYGTFPRRGRVPGARTREGERRAGGRAGQ